MSRSENVVLLRPAAVVDKVPQVILLFWVIKILATTVGETGGDALSMQLNLGYAVSSLIFMAVFAITLTIQIRSRAYHPFAYWAVVVATTTVGTTMSDFLDRSLKLGYVKSSIALFMAVLLMLWLWKRSVGQVRFEGIESRREELFYWVTILVSNTLGTALGDFAADDTGLNLGFQWGAVLFGALIAGVVLAHYLFKRIPAAALFWAAYILTRPLGATVGDTLTKAPDQGGIGLSRIGSSLTILAVMIVLIITMEYRQRRRA
ncbi:hypothetical protein JCM19000A_26830 [Silvimonas sp. JCM 19000]